MVQDSLGEFNSESKNRDRNESCVDKPAARGPGNKLTSNFFSQRHREHRGDFFRQDFPTASLRRGEMVKLFGSEF
jgi:hypothetical protein